MYNRTIFVPPNCLSVSLGMSYSSEFTDNVIVDKSEYNLTLVTSITIPFVYHPLRPSSSFVATFGEISLWREQSMIIFSGFTICKMGLLRVILFVTSGEHFQKEIRSWNFPTLIVNFRCNWINYKQILSILQPINIG